jgi:amino acid transporter
MPAAPPAAPTPRILGRAALVGLVLNSIIGSGVFVVPGTIGGMLGWAAVGAWIAGGAVMAVMIAAFAEVASRFEGAGGAYRYTRAAFGAYVGVLVAWLTYFARALSAAAQANLFTTALAEWWPVAATRVGEVVLITGFIGGFAWLNVRGTALGARTSSTFAGLKLVALVLLATAGIAWWAAGRAPVPAPPTATGVGGWFTAMLLLVFAYGGFEGALIPLGEARDPRRDAPWALGLGFALVVVVCVAVQVAVLATVAAPGETPRPLQAAARTMAGATGARLVTALVLASVIGWMAAAMLNMPRLTAALATDGLLPGALARLHPRFATPWVSVVVFAAVAWALALSAGLLQNVSLAAVARLFPYAGVCAALVAFRRRERAGRAMGEAGSALLRLPGGTLLGGLGFILALAIAARMNGREAASMVAVTLLATLHWWRVRRAG